MGAAGALNVLTEVVRLVEISRPWHSTIALAAAIAFAAFVWRARVRLHGRSLALCLALGAAGAGAAHAGLKLERAYVRALGRHLPTLTLLEPRTAERLGSTIALRAHATDEPGERGPIAAVRRVEFWLYHPSFAEQHPANHESKVLLGTVEGPTDDDLYRASWSCTNPFTPARDGDHGGTDGARSYVLPDDGRPYAVEAHGLDDEWFAKPGAPGKSERVVIAFTPCK